MIDEQTWQERWNGLNEHISDLITQYQNQPNLSRKETICVTLKCLQEFGRTQFDFFYKGFANNLLQKSENFPDEKALAATLDQISYDIAVMEKAAMQRSTENEWLAKADYLAYEALRPVLPTEGAQGEMVQKEQRDFILREPATVLTYFQKSTSVRIIPYAPVVLIGIPYTSKHAPWDFLAIPHEVGHHVYRYGLVKIQALYNFLQEERDVYTDRWFEELFADIYGALIAGPTISLSFQDLQMNNTIEQFYEDDNDHPVPILRPHIYMHLMKKATKSEISAWASHLQQNWQTYLEKRDEWLPKKIKHDKLGPDTYDESKISRKFKLRESDELFDVDGVISTDTADENKLLDLSIDNIRQILFEDIQEGSWPPDLREPTEAETAQDLRMKFRAYVETISTDDNALELSLSENGIIYVGNQSTNRKMGNTGLPMEINKNRLLNENEELTAKEWLYVLNAGGWTVKGPQCEGSGTCG